MRKQQIKATIGSVLLGVLSPLAMAMPVSAATVTWTGSGEDSNNSMNDALNWGGAVLVNGDTAVFPASGNYQMPDNDIVSSLVKIIFNGDNNFSSSKSYTLSGNAITLTSGIDAVMTGSGGDHAVSLDITLGADATFKTTGSNSLSVGAEGTTLDLGTNDLALDASGGTISLLGSIEGTGNIVKSGTSKVKILADSGAGYTGGLNLSAGEAVVDDALGLPVTVSGGTLKGVGTVGDVSMSAGTVAPGASPGVLNTGSLAYTGGTFDVELGGTAAGEFDQTNVTGTVDLGTATTLNISLFGGYEPAINDAFIIVNNDGTDAVVGNFAGLADGDKVIGAYTYQINYNAGDGNDIALLVTGNPGAPDTGTGSIIENPFVTLTAALLVAGAIVGYRVIETRKVRK